jgi:hypothetical protein
VLECPPLKPAHRAKLHSTNPLERLNCEIKRRTEVVGRCCQSNGNLSPVGRGLPNPRGGYSMTLRHSAKAAERLSL